MEWMRQYKEISELVIKVMNKYSSIHKKQLCFYKDHTLSFSEAQVIEEILRHKDANMTKLSKELGVTKAAITKTMKKLESKKYISRYKLLSNNKEILVLVTELGEVVYNNYQQYIYENLFKDIYTMFDDRDEKYVDDFLSFFRAADRSITDISKDKIDKE
ncbi:MarR family transcriptional regulator [Thiospirochaeta perfilievii]|uniref:MarR family transcriptional regulator n=1 Tax=Thiospirochaeta perfilievii TaxID=252967 RepID=A0A5C1Q9X8_9SPIO|nr:MarR family transcriptional regulator [Thiospirochaeta perfilievii]QEN04281.1 MarR family transcriptional regulator [Thiospirochaeta perfilievii]